MSRHSEAYADALRAFGVPESEIAEIVTNFEREDAALDARKCPQCGSDIQRTLDPRQAGQKCDDQAWFNYRCNCGFMMDRAE